MNVKELIEKLREMPQDAEVRFMENNSDLLYGVVSFNPEPVNRVYYNKTKERVELET